MNPRPMRGAVAEPGSLIPLIPGGCDHTLAPHSLDHLPLQPGSYWETDDFEPSGAISVEV